METAGNWLAWLAHGAMWVQAVWFLAACAIGIPWIIRDEIRFRRTAPKPAEVAAYASMAAAAAGTAMQVSQASSARRAQQASLNQLRDISAEEYDRRVALAVSGRRELRPGMRRLGQDDGFDAEGLKGRPDAAAQQKDDVRT